MEEALIDTEASLEADVVYKSLSEKAFSQGCGIDVLCGGVTKFAVPQMEVLVSSTGGSVLLFPGFDTPEVQGDLFHLLVRQGMSNGLDLTGCVLDVRCPKGVEVKSLLGPMTSDGFEGDGVYNFEEREALKATNRVDEKLIQSMLARVTTGRFYNKTSFCVCFEAKGKGELVEVKDEENSCVYFQFVARRVDSIGNVICQVTTQRVKTVDDALQHIECFNSDVLAVVLGKHAVLQAIEGTSGKEVSKKVDATTHKVSAEHKLNRARNDPSTFPSSLAEGLPRKLYHLKQGPLLGNLLQHDDDVACLRSFFMKLPFADCLRLMAPTLTKVQRDGSSSYTFNEVPADTLALWDNAVLAMDYDAQFVWSGRGVTGPEYDDLRNEAERLLLYNANAGERFPSGLPLQRLVEGGSMARFVTARLSRSDRDPPEQQLAHYPELASLSADELRSLRAKFGGYAIQEVSYRNWFWKVCTSTFEGKGGEGLF